MTWSLPNPAPEALLAQQDFVRALVRSLLRGADGEDDVVQRAWLRALRRSPDDPEKGKSWLARVARNLVRDDARENRRREERERLAARPEGLPSAAEVLQREAERRRVVDAVLGLAEPYRTTVLMRYWEDLPPATIAERMGLPGATVRSRLRRGLEMLRQKLDDEFGDRRAWVVALSPTAKSGGATLAASTLGALLMSTKLKAIASLLLLGLLGLVVWSVARPGGQPFAPEGRGVPPGLTAELGGDRSPATSPDPEAAQPGRQPVLAAVNAFTLLGDVRRNGQPFPGLELTLQWYEGIGGEGQPASEYPVRSDERGEFVWHGPAPGVASTTRVVSEDPHYQVFDSPVVVFPDDREAFHQITVTPMDCELTGVVRDEEGKPIQDAKLSSNGWRETATDDQGRYRLLVGNGDDSRPLIAWAEGYAQRLETMDIPEGATTWEVDLTLQAGSRITGRVVYKDGTPVEGADVKTGGRFFPVVTDAEGRFVLGSLGRLGNHRVTATKPGFAPASVFSYPGGEGLELVLEPGLAVNGRVVGPDGRPVRGASIGVFSQNSGLRTRGFSQADGGFRLEGLGPGELQLIIGKRGFASGLLAVEVGGDVEDLLVRLEEGQVLRGRVTDLESHPIAGASVYCEEPGGMVPRPIGEGGQTDAEGRFEVRDLPSGRFTVHAFRHGYLRGSLEDMTAGTAELHIRLQKGAAVAGRVLDGSTQQPLREFTVVVNERPNATFVEPLRFANTDGYWSMRSQGFPGLTLGATLYVDVRAEGYAPLRTTATAEIDPDPDRNLLLLYPAVTLQGIVRDAATGEPVPRASIRLLGPGESPSLIRISIGRLPEATSDASGHFSMSSVGPGPMRLVVIHPGYADTVHGPIHVGIGPGSVDVRVEMRHGVTLRGRVVGFGAPQGLTVIAQGFAMVKWHPSEVQSDGSFAFEGLSPEMYGLTLQYGGTSRYVWVEVGEHDVDGVEIRESEGRGVIRATVRGLDRGGIEIIPMSDLPKTRHPSTRLLEFENGRFEVDGLAEGRYRVQVFDHEDSDRSRETEVDLSERHETEVVFEFDA